MTGFSADWLSLRAPADDAARDPALLSRLANWAETRGGVIKVADYGGGTGAGFRALSPHLPPAQQWRILDDDAALLSAISKNAQIETVHANLALNPEAGTTPRPDIITGFAFFDLVSAEWIDRLVPLIAETGAAVYAPLTYDGVETWSPTPPHEPEALAAFNEDMRRDKGFGPALGADAAPYLADALRRAGYDVSMAASPWTLSVADQAPLITALATGGAQAVGGALSGDALDAWLAGRKNAQSVSIGHWDILALPKPT
ncbi:MAG: class I SAM-dependent methyltransferase [Pikeienuella sp.]